MSLPIEDSVGFVSTDPSRFLAANEVTGDPATMRRRAKALAILAANPGLRIAVVAEAGDPAIIGVAIRCKAYGEFEIAAASYDGLALLAMLERYGAESPQTVH